MEKRGALLIALIITLLVAGNYYVISGNVIKENREKAIVSRIIDGDTVELEDGRIVRLLNINTPEKNELGSNLAKEYMLDLQNKSVEIEITGNDKYKRYLARLFDERYINLELVRLGFAKKFLVDDGELKDFDYAENMAVEREFGIWHKSPYRNCLVIEVDKKKELLEISNACYFNLTGIVIEDESRKKYVFVSDFRKVVLHSGEGKNNSTDVFWNMKTDIWNNDRDTIYARDKNGGLIYHESYGY